MDADTILATGTATLHRHGILGHNNHYPINQRQVACRVEGRPFAAGEAVRTPSLTLPQVRQTATLLGCQEGDAWGLCNGLNEHQLAVATTSWRSRLAGHADGVLNTDLVRLALERCSGARQALDFITDLVSRYGQTTPRGDDGIFVLADPREAYLLETAGSCWAWTECRSVRAASGMAVIRQDWQRLAPGTAEHVASKGWWECDGSKVDFVGCLADSEQPNEAAQRHWGRATYLLEEQHGHIDAGCVRRILCDNFENSEHAPSASRRERREALHGPHGAMQSKRWQRLTAGQTCNSMICVLQPAQDSDVVPLAWLAFGPPHLGVYVPLFLDGELPLSYSDWHPTSVWVRIQGMLAAIAGDADQGRIWQQTAARLQTRIDQDTDEFLAEMRVIKASGAGSTLPRHATLFMQSHVELLENALRKPQMAPSHNLVYAD